MAEQNAKCPIEKVDRRLEDDCREPYRRAVDASDRRWQLTANLVQRDWPAKRLSAEIRRIKNKQAYLGATVMAENIHFAFAPIL